MTTTTTTTTDAATTCSLLGSFHPSGKRFTIMLLVPHLPAGAQHLQKKSFIYGRPME